MDVRMPDGTLVQNVPDGVTKEQILAKLGQSIPAKVAEADRSFTDRVKAKLDQRMTEVKQTEADLLSGKLNGVTGRLQGFVQVLGKGVAGPFLDTVGEGLVSTGKGISFLVPDVIEQPVVNAFKDSWNYLTKTGSGKKALSALNEGMDKYNEWKAENPQDAKTFESVADIGLMYAPSSLKAKSEPNILGKTADVLGKRAARQIAKNRVKFTEDLVSPKRTPKVKVEETSRTREAGVGPFKRSVIEPSSEEVAMAKEVSRINDVKPTNSIQGNMNIVSGENKKLAQNLEKMVEKSKIKIPFDESSQVIDDVISTIKSENPLIVGDAEKIAEKIGVKAKQIIAKNGETGSGLLRSRKELDAWVRSQKGDKIFNPNTDSAISIAVREIRNSMNDLLDSKVSNQFVKRELKRQNLLYRAIDNMAPKAAEESNTALGRAWANSLKLLPFKNKLVQEAALISGIGGLGAAARFAPVFTASLVTFTAGGGAVKLIMSPQAKKFAGKVISMIDKALPASRNENMIKQLRADRALIMQSINNSESE